MSDGQPLTSAAGLERSRPAPIDWNFMQPAERHSAIPRRLRIAFNRVEAHWYDLRHGTDTRGKAAASELADIAGPNVDHGTGYQAVNASHFHEVMRALPFPYHSVFLDIGCGKGKPLLLAAGYGFVDRAIGVEFGGALCAIARRNVERSGLSRKIDVLHMDALAFPLEPRHNIFFLNNPFDEELFAAFVDRIAASVRRHPRPVWVLYGNPIHLDVLAAHDAFEPVKRFCFFGPGRDIAVFQSRMAHS